MNLFWYTRVEGEKEYLDALNLQKVIRVITLENGQVLVLMDDIHNRISENPVTNKQGKITGMKNTTLTVQSEIYLSKEDDIKRFYELTTKENNND